MNAHPDDDVGQAIPREFAVITREGGAYGEGSLHGVVALPGVRLQCAEENEDAIAQESTDPTAVVGDRVAHKLEIAIEHLRQHLRFEPLGQRGVTCEVGEHRGKHLVLGNAFRAIRKQAFDHTGRRKHGTRLLQALQFDRGCFDACA